MINIHTYINTDESGNILAVSLITFIDGLPTTSKNIILNELTEQQINEIKDFNTFVDTLPYD